MRYLSNKKFFKKEWKCIAMKDKSITIDRAKPSHTWIFRQKTPSALEVEAVINNSEIEWCNTQTDYWLKLYEEQSLIRSLLRDAITPQARTIAEASKSEVGFQIVKEVLGEHKLVLIRKEMFDKWRGVRK